MMKKYLDKIINCKHLTQNEAKEAMLLFASGKVNEVQMSAFLTAYIIHPPTGKEFSGFREAMLENAITIDLEGDKRIDIVGTGGDGKNTFNISTTAAFVVAGAGYKVTKHGSYGVSSNCGSADVLAELGYQYTTNQDDLQRKLDKGNFCFMHAPLFHPTMKKVVPIRKALGLRTFFNILGPLLNPSNPTHQLSGVYAPEVVEQYREVFDAMGLKYAVVYDKGGYDEISLTNDVIIVTNKEKRSYTPNHLGFDSINPNAIGGGESTQESAKIMTNILQDKGTREQKSVAIANAAIAIQILSGCDLADAKQQAIESIESSNAYTCLKNILD